jgi:endonuclease/exonuclease/phosphatase family metal-dependent hydrolase
MFGVWLVLLALPQARAQSPATNQFVLVSWNVENLFDPDPDLSGADDKDFTPRGWARWTPERYALKLAHLAEVIAAMRPDVLCLSEVENRRVLEDLSRVLREQQHYDLPVIIHREGEDRRGIDVAMLARLAPVATNWLTPVPRQRDILMARFEPDGRPLTLCLNHWKSWRGPAAENLRIRTAEARAARAEIVRCLAGNAAGAIAALGDFNDNVDAPSLTREAGFVPWRAAPPPPATNGAAVLYNLSGLLGAEARGTYYYGKDRVWNSFDSISVSRGMLPGGASTSVWQVLTNSYGPFVLPRQRDEDGRPLPFHRVRKKDATGTLRDIYYTGYSDHFPVRVVLQALDQSGAGRQPNVRDPGASSRSDARE